MRSDNEPAIKAWMDDVVKAAKAVGAHEFILELPYGDLDRKSY